MKVDGTDGVDLVVSQRLAWKVKINVRTVVEMLGLPAATVSDTFAFPWYADNSLMKTELRIGNVGASNSNATVTIGTTSYGPYLIKPNTTAKLVFAGVNAGPVTVTGTAAVPLVVHGTTRMEVEREGIQHLGAYGIAIGPNGCELLLPVVRANHRKVGGHRASHGYSVAALPGVDAAIARLDAKKPAWDNAPALISIMGRGRPSLPRSTY